MLSWILGPQITKVLDPWTQVSWLLSPNSLDPDLWIIGYGSFIPGSKIPGSITPGSWVPEFGTLDLSSVQVHH